MAAGSETALPESRQAAPVVIVGTGPVGVCFAQELSRRQPGMPMVIYGNEPWMPYDRTRLSSYLAGETDWDALGQGMSLPDSPLVDVRLNCAVIEIDRLERSVRDAAGRAQSYSRLVLAIGAGPRIPDIPGIGLSNIFVLRDMSDVQRLAARHLRSRRTVVIGGGSLGLEAARAMRRFHTDVWLVEHSRRLMMNDLDAEAAERLRKHVEERGIRVLLEERVRHIHGNERVNSVSLRNGRLDCDTVIVAAGVQPNIQLARQSGLLTRRGIRVSDQLRTSDPDIFAIGECAEHRDTVYGCVAAGREQAFVAARSVLGEDAQYAGSVAQTQLTLLDLEVSRMGRVGERDRLDHPTTLRYRGVDAYRSLVIERGRLAGAMSIGPCPDMARLRHAIAHRHMIYPWQALRFRRTGSLWPVEDASARPAVAPRGLALTAAVIAVVLLALLLLFALVMPSTLAL